MKTDKRPNILVINPDQMRADALHHLGCDAAYTPCIDALAADGVSFRNAFCQNPVCAPSRCSFTTGLYPHTNGHRTMSYLLRRGEENIFSELKKSGYRVWMSGRGDCLAGQDKKWLRECSDRIYYRAGRDRLKDDGRGEKGSERYRSFYRGTLSTDNEDGICHDNDYQWTLGCEEFIRNHGDGPFFAFLGLMNPHPPYRAEEKYLRLIDESKITPRKPANELDKKSKMERGLREALKLDGWGEENFTALRRTYLAQCARVDELTGRVIKALKDTGQYDNTVIFFMSDHGDFTGDYSLVEKAQNLFYDCLTNVPFVIKPPAGFPVDRGISESLAELVDFYATALDFAGVKSGHTNFGKSLKCVLADREKQVRDCVFSEGGRLPEETHCAEEVEEYFGIRADDYEPRISVQNRPTGEHGKAVMARDRDFKYILRLDDTDELYVLKISESVNEIDNPAYAGEAERLRNEILMWYLKTCDTVPFDKDSRFSDDYYLETVNALAGFRISPAIKAVMTLTRNDFSTLINKALKTFKIDTNKFYKY